MASKKQTQDFDSYYICICLVCGNNTVHLITRMRNECKSCKKWKEQMYWSQFQVVQFFQILSEHFDRQLAIPQKFANNLREKLGASVSLTGPSGATWNVGLTPIGDTLFLKHGWKEFVDAHSLEQDDMLIFKYKGASRFDVSVFDRQSSCEKEASCFVTKCEHADVASGSRTKRHTTSESTPHDVSKAPATKKPKVASTPTSDDTSESSSHDEYEPPIKKSKVASTPTSEDTSESSSHDVSEAPATKKPKSTSTPTSEDTSESSSHDEYEPSTKK